MKGFLLTCVAISLMAQVVFNSLVRANKECTEHNTLIQIDVTMRLRVYVHIVCLYNFLLAGRHSLLPSNM